MPSGVTRNKTVTVINDPNGLWEPGAVFGSVDLAAMTQLGVWEDGVHLLISPVGKEKFEAVTVLGVPVSLEDGKCLKVFTSGSYGWEHYAPEWPMRRKE